MYYAGIGSRETSNEVLIMFEQLAEWIAKHGDTLRSGHALGADTAFETGCDRANGKKEIYLPWRGFNQSDSNLIFKPYDESANIARKFHPYFDKLSQGAQKLQARNSYQILGYTLDKPADFVLCWTKNGAASGGTGQAIRLAVSYDIPVLDFGKFDNLKAMQDESVRFYRDMQARQSQTERS